MINSSRNPPRPTPGMVSYSDEDSGKGYDENPDDSDSLTEKPSEISSTDSQVNRQLTSLEHLSPPSPPSPLPHPHLHPHRRVSSRAQSLTAAAPEATRTPSSTTTPTSTTPSASRGRSRNLSRRRRRASRRAHGATPPSQRAPTRTATAPSCRSTGRSS